VRHRILRSIVVLVAVVVAVTAVTFWLLYWRHNPQERPYVEVVTTRCLGPDGVPVGDEYGQPCPSGTTQDTVVIQSFLPTTE
jgi:hypothetical protein